MGGRRPRGLPRGAGAPTPHDIRIAPSTPRLLNAAGGYARALTAVVSQLQLDQGRRYCFLFTDLANPTSNRSYQSIG